MRQESGESKGFGFACFKDPACALKALSELNGKEVDGKSIFVGKALNKEQRQAEV